MRLYFFARRVLIFSIRHQRHHKICNIYIYGILIFHTLHLMRLDNRYNGNHLFANKEDKSINPTAVMADVSTTPPTTPTTPPPTATTTVANKKPTLTNQISFRILDRRKTQRRQQARAQNKMPATTSLTPVAPLTTNGDLGAPPSMLNGHASLKRSLARRPLPFITENNNSDDEVSFITKFFDILIRDNSAGTRSQNNVVTTSV